MDPPNPRIRGHQSRAVSGSAIIPGNLTINDIPDEILLYIIKWVPIYHKSDLSIVSYGQLSLRNLALCYRRFHQLVEPILYERLHHNRHTTQNGIVMFLTRILARPDLAKRVKAIHTTVTYGKLPSRGPFEMTCVNNDNWARIRSRVAGACHLRTHRDDWVEGIELGFWQPIVALIITLTPNLEVLDFDHWNDEYVVPGPTMFGQLSLWWTIGQARMLQVDGQTKNPLGLWKLNSVQLGRSGGGGRFNIDRLLAFATLPSLETARAKYVNSRSITYDTRWHDSDLRFSNVKELSLTCTDVSPSAFAEYLGRFPNLNRLCYTIGGVSAAYEGSLSMQSVGSILESISHLKPHLQDLTLLDLGCFDAYKHYTAWNLTWSLASFPALRRLDTTWLVLTGIKRESNAVNVFENMLDIVDVIPSSLEWLRVRDFHKLYKVHDVHTIPVYEQILLLLAHKHRFPALKQLDLGWERYRHNDRPWAREPFKFPGFTEEQALDVLTKCEEVSV